MDRELINMWQGKHLTQGSTTEGATRKAYVFRELLQTIGFRDRGGWPGKPDIQGQAVGKSRLELWLWVKSSLREAAALLLRPVNNQAHQDSSKLLPGYSRFNHINKMPSSNIKVNVWVSRNRVEPSRLMKKTIQEHLGEFGYTREPWTPI